MPPKLVMTPLMSNICSKTCPQVVQNNQTLKSQNQSLNNQVQTLQQTQKELKKQLNQMNTSNSIKKELYTHPTIENYSYCQSTGCPNLKQQNQTLKNQNQTLTNQVQTLTAENNQLTNKLNQKNQQNMQQLNIPGEFYISPYTTSPQAQPLQKTCHPLTPHVTPSFQMAREIRTPYDQYWLKMYNTHSLNENYNLP